jgi:hypothetical protein
MAQDPPQQPPAINFILSFLLVGLAWGLTTPFIRRAARDHRPPAHPVLSSAKVQQSWLRKRVYTAFFAVVDLLRNPRYAVPLVLNLTGSVWFFLLIGKAGQYFPSHFPLYGGLGVRMGGWLTKGNRTEPDGADCQHPGLFVYRRRGVVGRGQGHQSRYVSILFYEPSAVGGVLC